MKSLIIIFTLLACSLLSNAQATSQEENEVEFTVVEVGKNIGEQYVDRKGDSFTIYKDQKGKKYVLKFSNKGRVYKKYIRNSYFKNNKYAK